tara:strand:- start:1062 stop:1253 length:192 start_codon:yes stop_codon:yes gene_type:complete
MGAGRKASSRGGDAPERGDGAVLECLTQLGKSCGAVGTHLLKELRFVVEFLVDATQTIAIEDE